MHPAKNTYVPTRSLKAGVEMGSPAARMLQLWHSKQLSDTYVVFGTDPRSVRAAVRGHMQAHVHLQSQAHSSSASKRRKTIQVNKQAAIVALSASAAAEAPAWPDSCHVLQAHAVTLCRASELFHLQLTGNSPVFEEDQQLRVHTAEGDKHVVVVGVENAHDLQLAEPLLRYLYKGEVDAQDRLDADKLFKATDIKRSCAEALAALPADQLPLPIVGCVLALFASTGTGSEMKQLQEKCEACVMTAFKDVVDVAMDGERLASFCSLPFVAVKIWAASDELGVDSENLVLWMLHQWYMAQTSSGADLEEDDQPDDLDDQMTELSALVRVSQLTPTYLMAAMGLDWFKPHDPLYELAPIRFNGEMGHIQAARLGQRWPEAWVSGTKRRTVQHESIDLVVSEEQLQQGLDQVKAMPAGERCNISSSSCTVLGFELQLGLWLEHLEQGKCQVTLGLALKTDDVKGPWQQGQQPPVSIAADLHVQLGGAVPRATYRNGAETVLLKHISTRLTATGQTWSYAVSRVSHVSQLSDYIRDRELRLRASLTKLDGQLLPRRV